MENDLYDILGVDRLADRETIQAAYRRQIGLYHPDKVTTLGPALRRLAEERSKAINDAYAILGNAVLRASYDRQRQASPMPVLQTPPPPPPSSHAEREELGGPASPPDTKQPATRLQRVAWIGSAWITALTIVILVGGYSLGLLINIALITTYVSVYTTVQAMLATMRLRGSRHLFGRIQEIIVRTILIAVAGLLFLTGVFLVEAAIKQPGPTGMPHHWMMVLVWCFVGFTTLLFAQSLAPRRVDRLLLIVRRFGALKLQVRRVVVDRSRPRRGGIRLFGQE